MATYTLSHTGAEVDSAVANALNLFSTPHTWTAEQTFTNLTIQTGGLTVAEITTNEATIKSLRVEGAGAFASFGGGVVFKDYVTIESTGSLQVDGVANFAQNVIITGDVTAGSATIGGETDISGDLIVSGGEIYGSFSATDDLDMNGYEITGTHALVAQTYLGAPELYVQKEQSVVSLVSSGSGIASAPHDGFYIDSDGTITRFRTTGSIPASVLVVYFR